MKSEPQQPSDKPPEFSNDDEKLKYWLSKTPEERVAEVERLRREKYGDLGRIQKVVRIIKRSEDMGSTDEK
jgi:hypothetical protein